MFRFGHSLFSNAYGGGAPVIDNDFVIRVKTDNAGTSASNQFTLPTTNVGLGASVYDYTIDWGDGTIENINVTTAQTHTYPTVGEYTIKISGSFPRIYFNNGGDRRKLIETVNFGNVGWITLASAFLGCTNNVINASCTGNFDLVTSGASAFQNNNSITVFPAINMPLCTTIRAGWSGCNSLVSFGNCDFSSVSTVELAWSGCSSLSTFGSCDFGSANDFRQAFQNCGVISSFATRNFYGMTLGASCFLNTTLPTADYSDILITQNANNPNNSVTLHGGNSTYNSSALSARTNLVSTKLWTITDAGLV